MFHWLDRAYDERDPILTSIRAHPAVDGARDDPRYRRLLERMGLT